MPVSDSHPPGESADGRADRFELKALGSATVDRVRAGGNVWNLPGGQLLLPQVFGFCRGVKRAVAMLAQAVEAHDRDGKRLFLLGQIIHNPQVNDYFRRRGVRILTARELAEPEKLIGPADCAVIPAFGVPLPVERRLRSIGCEVVDTSCGDVRRLWAWAEQAAGRGFGVVIFGRAEHDETVVTKSRLAAAGGRYLVLEDIDKAEALCEMITGRRPAEGFGELFDARTTNAESIEQFSRLAQVSQTTMLYAETMQVRRLIGDAFELRYGRGGLDERLLFEPTVCRATQARQDAAVELCRTKPDLVIVVGGFGSSNTRHLYELARRYGPAWFIEDAQAIRSANELHTIDLKRDAPIVVRRWLPARSRDRARPLRIGVLAGASSPEVVIEQVLQRLAAFLR